MRLFEVKNIPHKIFDLQYTFKTNFLWFSNEKLIKTDILPMRRKVKSDDYVPIYLRGSQTFDKCVHEIQKFDALG